MEKKDLNVRYHIVPQSVVAFGTVNMMYWVFAQYKGKYWWLPINQLFGVAIRHNNMETAQFLLVHVIVLHKRCQTLHYSQYVHLTKAIRLKYVDIFQWMVQYAREIGFPFNMLQYEMWPLIWIAKTGQWELIGFTAKRNITKSSS